MSATVPACASRLLYSRVGSPSHTVRGIGASYGLPVGSPPLALIRSCGGTMCLTSSSPGVGNAEYVVVACIAVDGGGISVGTRVVPAVVHSYDTGLASAAGIGVLRASAHVR